MLHGLYGLLLCQGAERVSHHGEFLVNVSSRNYNNLYLFGVVGVGGFAQYSRALRVVFSFPCGVLFSESLLLDRNLTTTTIR